MRYKEIRNRISLIFVAIGFIAAVAVFHNQYCNIRSKYIEHDCTGFKLNNDWSIITKYGNYIIRTSNCTNDTSAHCALNYKYYCIWFEHPCHINDTMMCDKFECYDSHVCVKYSYNDCTAEVISMILIIFMILFGIAFCYVVDKQ